MRSEAELRTALAVLEQTIAVMPRNCPEFDIMAGEIAGLRYALGEEVARPSLADTLPKMRELLTEYALDPSRN